MKDKGVALILVMLSLMVLSVLAAAIVFTARTETLASYNWKLDTQADYLAKAGIQYGLNWLRSSRYVAVSPSTTVSSYYTATASGGTYNTYTSNNSPVQCVGTTNCTAGNPVAMISIPSSTLSSNYPTSAPGASNVISNFTSDFPSSGVLIKGSATDQGVVYVNMVLLNYQTVENGSPPNLTPAPMETWQITSRAYWTGAANAVGSYPIAVAEEQAVVQPIYVPSFANAMYGYCSASMGGSSGTCTDAFNSALGCYDAAAGCTNGTAAGSCNASSTNNIIDAGAGVGANGYVSLGSNVSVGGNVTLGSNPDGGSSCCTLNSTGTACATQFSGSAANVLGQVVAGPSVPVPPPPNFPANLASAPSEGAATVPVASCILPNLTLTAASGGAFTAGTYFYTVTAVFSTWPYTTVPPATVQPVSGAVLTPPVESAQAEQSVTVTASQEVKLSWTAVTGASSYKVYRGTSSGAENVYYQTTSASLTDLGTTTGSPGTSGLSLSCVSSGTPPASCAAASPPNGLAQYPSSTPVGVPSVSQATGACFSSGTVLYYVVTALGAWGESTGTEIASPGYTVPASKKCVTVSWSSYTGATGYRIYRGPSTGTTQGGENQYATVGAVTTYSDPGGALTAGTPPTNIWANTPFGSKTGANPPFLGCGTAGSINGSPCADTPCLGTEMNPFEISSVSLTSSSMLQLIGGRDILHPVYYDIKSISEAGNGSIMISGYVVLNVGGPTSPAGSCSTPGSGSFDIHGNGTAAPVDYFNTYGVTVNVPPECLQINYTGSTMALGGNGAMSGVVTAPCGTVTLKGGGSGGYMIGAIRALNVQLQGGYPLHYDVQLSKAGGIVGTMATSAYSRRKF